MPRCYKPKKSKSKEFPGGLLVRTQRFHCYGPGSVPGWETPQRKKKGEKKEKQSYKKTTFIYSNKFNPNHLF